MWTLFSCINHCKYSNKIQKDILIRINLCYYFKKLLYLPQKYISIHT